MQNGGMTDEPETPAPPVGLWAAARADYMAGCSAPVVAERYGLSERTVRRHAAEQGWRRTDAPLPDFRRSGPASPPSLSREEMIERCPELAVVEQAAFDDRFGLLINPDQKKLRRYAFKQAAEAAAAARPAEAVLWMRLVQTLERTGDRIDSEAAPFREQDHIRAAWLREADRLPAASAFENED